MALCKTTLLGAALFLCAAVLGGCSFVQESLLPALTGETPAGKKAPQKRAPEAAKPAPAGQPAAAESGAGKAEAQAAALGKPTGTPVGEKVDEIRQEVIKLEGSVGEHDRQFDALHAETASNIEQYQQGVAAINTKLQVGTTAGNPELLDQWNEAKAALGKIDGNVAAMNALSTAVGDDSARAGSLLDRARAAYALPGAVDEDHHQLALLEEAIAKTQVTIGRLSTELAADTRRQIAYLPRERGNLATLAAAIKSGELPGTGLTGSVAAPAFAPAGADARAGIAKRKPLVVIRFDQPDVEYEPALYKAVNAALERKPDVDFDVVAVAPATGDAAQAARAASESKQHADAVMRSLANMGLPASRITLSAITSATAATSEVHLYIR